ncbi:hypothetical protein LTS18_002227 [Coniosporium uncinatum]|uniref:Uncharacterized protein n=1 Tax=Coniosporium uncinatum TaxID=93489 RepID=A0ACC3D7V7_9PEZI|nr:hypothetical protein LTS18_002227 [Coniosporium uncinatum]
MLVMAHLFGRHPCRHADQEWIERVVKRSPSVVFLPDLPQEAGEVLRNHNQETLQVFRTYVSTYIEQHIQDEDRRLPLSRMEFSGSDSTAKLPETLGMLPPNKICSSFIGLSGHDDSFDSIADLCHSTRGGVFLEESVIPHVALWPDETDLPLNAYLYDFYQHGNVRALAEANGIRRGDVWFLLNDFSLILATIITSLSNFMKLSPESDVGLIDVMGSGDAFEDRKDDVDVDADGGAEQDGDGTGKPAWQGDDGRGLLKVLKAFQTLKAEFDETFKKMWA